ncbi:uncharacterized protein V6R79_000667 [Siganus canaliculatus]
METAMIQQWKLTEPQEDEQTIEKMRRNVTPASSGMEEQRAARRRELGSDREDERRRYSVDASTGRALRLFHLIPDETLLESFPCKVNL